MKYKLKDFVTDEMLVECGFSVCQKGNAWRETTYTTVNCNYLDNKKIESIFIYHKKPNDSNYYNHIENEIIWSNCTIKDSIKPYIQDLIDKGYVEVVE